ncbi:MAG: MoaD/ThiS family protein [Microthrixaceae bacterium]|nr:MoaD/ThiS family protein [Microthrixaceae bacterium]
MIVKLRNPSRDVEVEGPALVSVVLEKLEINRESVLVIRNGEIIPNDTRLEDDDVIEIRPVISGGAFGPDPREASPHVGSEVPEP